MIRALLGVFWSHWRRNMVQLATLVMGIALATALWTGVQAINAEARAGLEAAARTANAAELPRLERRDGADMTMQDVVTLRRAGVLVSPILSGAFQPRPGVTLTLTGIDPLTAPEGVWPQQDFTASPDTAARIFLPEAVQAGPDQANHPAVPDGQAIADIGVAQQALGRDGFDALILTPPQPLGAPDPLSVLPGLVRVDATTDADPAELTRSFRLNLTAFGGLCFVVGLFIVRATVGLAMAQRRRTVAVLRALGVPMRLLGALMPGVSLTLDGIYGAGIGASVRLRPVWWLGGLAIAILGTLASAAGPLIRTARRPVMSRAPELKLRLPVTLGLGLLLLSALLAFYGGSLVAGFAAMAALLLGAAALMPPCLSLLLRAAAPLAYGPVAQWTLAETRAQIPQMALAMTALLMALSANIGVGTMVDSFRRSFTDFIDQRLAAELYVATPDGGAELRRILAPMDARALPLQWADAQVAGQRSEIYGVVDDPTYRRGWALLSGLPDAWDRLHQDGAAIINEQLRYRAGLAPGQTIALPDGPAEIAGVISDYGNPFGKVLVSETRLNRIAPAALPSRFAIRSDDPERLRARLIAAGIPADRIGMQAELKAASLRIFERTFAVTAALNTLTLGVAGFAVLTSLLTIADSRLPRLAPLWAMGLDRRALAGLELARVAITAALTALLALPVGLALCWLLLSVVNVEAFGWRLPFRADPAAWLVLMALGCAAAVLAALWPAWRLAKLSPRALTEVQTLDQ